MNEIYLKKLLDDFFSGNDTARLCADAGMALGCPILLIDDTFHVVAHHGADGFSDSVFTQSVEHGEISYEAGVVLSESKELAGGGAAFISLDDSPYRRRCSALQSSGIRLGYLICVDVNGELDGISEESFRQLETVFAKQLYIEAGRSEIPCATAEEILISLLNGKFDSRSRFELQASSTYLANFEPSRFALIDLTAYHSSYLGRNRLKDELMHRFYDSHPFLYNGNVILFLNSDHDVGQFEEPAAEFHIKVVISRGLSGLYSLPKLYSEARAALDIVAGGALRGSVYSVEELGHMMMLGLLERESCIIDERISALAAHDAENGTEFCETLYYYLCSAHSLKRTCEAMFTHRNTVLYRINKIRDDFEIPLEDASEHFRLLLSVSLVLLKAKGFAFFAKEN